jgi:hypothetical protein
VFRRKLIPQCRKRVNYDLCAANGSTIPTYRWLPLSLNLGLRRDFTWLFVVADVTQPLISDPPFQWAEPGCSNRYKAWYVQTPKRQYHPASEE